MPIEEHWRIAGKGIAEVASSQNAFDVAIAIAGRRRARAFAAQGRPGRSIGGPGAASTRR